MPRELDVVDNLQNAGLQNAAAPSPLDLSSYYDRVEGGKETVDSLLSILQQQGLTDKGITDYFDLLKPAAATPVDNTALANSFDFSNSAGLEALRNADFSGLAGYKPIATDGGTTGALPNLDKYEVRTIPGEPIYSGEAYELSGHSPDKTVYIDKATGKEVSARDYRIDTKQASAQDQLTAQILGQGFTGKWSGEGFGSAEANAADIAKVLTRAGITDINDFGKVTVAADANVTPIYDYRMEDRGGEEGMVRVPYVVGYTGPDGKPVDPSLVKVETTGDVEGSSYNVYTAPIGTTQVFGNTRTGQALDAQYDRADVSKGIFSGTFAGKDSTHYGVQFTPDGKPIFYTQQGASTSDVGALLPIISLGLNIFAPGAGSALGAALGATAGSAAASIIGNAVIQGALAEASGGDFVKGALSSAAGGITGGFITPEIASALGNTDIARVVANSVSGGILSSINGGDFATGALAGGTNAAVSLALPNVPGFSDLTTQAKNSIANLATSLVTKGTITEAQALNALGGIVTSTLQTGSVPNAKDFEEGYFKPGGEGYVPGTGDITNTLTGAGLVDGSGNDANVTKLLDDAVTFDATDSTDDNAAAKSAIEAGYNKFKFDGKTWTIADDENKKIADFEASVLADTTAANLKGGEFEGYDKAVADQLAAAKLKIVPIKNAEADNPDEAAYLAKLRDPTATQFSYGGNIYTMGVSSAAMDKAVADSKAALLREDIANAPTRAAAFKIAKEGGLGAKDVFTWQGNSYSAATAAERPDLTGKTPASTVTTNSADQSAAETARLLAQNQTLSNASTTNQSDAETKRLLAQNASLIKGNVTANQSAAEMARLAALNNTLVVGNAPNESFAETQRLMEAGSRTAAENLSSMALQALGTTVRGAGSFLTNAGNTYAQITGDFNYANTATRLGKELEDYAKGRDIYGLDVQKTRLNQSLDQADRTDNFLEKTDIIRKAIYKNPLGFFDVAGTEFVEEAPSTALQIAAALATGGGSIAAQTGGRFIAGTVSLADSFLETFGSAGKEAYQKSIARGDPKEVAKNKSYINASIHAVAEMVPDFIADKALIAPIMKNFAEKTLTSIGTAFGTNTAAGLVSELVSGAAQSYSTQYVVDPKTASWSKALTDGIFESAIGGTVQTAMATPTTVVDTGAVIGRDYSGKDVTLQQVIDGGSNIDASTVNAGTPIATTADGSTLTVGSAMATTSSSNPGLDVFSEFLPANLKGDDVKPVDLGDVGDVVPGDTTTPAGPADLGPVGTATPGADTVTGTDLGAIGSVVPGSDAAVGSNVAAVGAGTPGAITVADAQSVMADLGLNVSDDTAVSLASQITNAASQSDTSNVAASIVAGNDASSTVASSIASSVAAGANASGTISSTVGSAIAAGADAATVIGSAVASSIGSGVAADTAISSTVGSAITSGANASSTVNSAVSSALNAGTGVDTAIGSSVASAVNSGAAFDTAAAAAISAAANAGANMDVVIGAANNAATSTGNNVSITSGANTVTISNSTSNTQTTINTSTGAATTFDANTGTTSDVSVASATAPTAATAQDVATTQNAATTPNAATAQNVATTQNVATAPNIATTQNVATAPNVTTYLPRTTATPVTPTPVTPTPVTPTTVTPTPVTPDLVPPTVVEPPVVKPPEVAPPVTPPKVTPPKTTPPTKKQVAQMLGVPASDPVVQDVIEALYGTMDYLDISKEFSASERKAKPAATTKQKQQTKMAEGGYLDDLLAENMSVDDLLHLLR